MLENPTLTSCSCWAYSPLCAILVLPIWASEQWGVSGFLAVLVLEFLLPWMIVRSIAARRRTKERQARIAHDAYIQQCRERQQAIDLLR